MKIQEYFKKYNIKISQFAHYHKISRYSLSKYLKGSVPSPKIAAKIYKATNQEVTFKDMGFEDDKR